MLNNQIIHLSIESFVKDPIKKVLLILTDGNEEANENLIQQFLSENIAITHIRLIEQDICNKILNETPSEKSAILIFTGLGKGDYLENIYVKYQLQHWQAKIIFICDKLILHPSLDSSIYFAPIKGNKVQKHLLSTIDLTKVPLLDRPQVKFSKAQSLPEHTNKETPRSPEELPLHYLNRKVMVDDLLIMQMLGDRVQADGSFKYLLLQLVLTSRTNPELQIAAANAITALNYARTSFADMDLSYIRIPYADLRFANLDQTDLSYADMMGVKLQQAFMKNTKIMCSNLMHAEFNELPYLKNKKKDIVNFICFDTDGSLLFAAAGNDIEVWDWVNSAIELILQGHDSKVNCMTVKPDNKLLATGSSDKTIRLWNFAEGNCVKILVGHQEKIIAVSFNRAGTMLASGSKDKTIRLWDIEKAETIRIINSHTARVTSLQYDATGQFLVSAGYDGKISIWYSAAFAGSLYFNKPVNQLTLKQEHFSCMQFSPDNATLAIGSHQGTIYIYNFIHETTTVLNQHTDKIKALQYDASGKFLLSAGDDEVVYLWDLENNTHRLIATGHIHAINSMQIHPTEQNLLVTASNDGTIRFTRTDYKLQTYVIPGHAGAVLSVCASPDGRLVASGGGTDFLIKIWDAVKGLLLHTLAHHSGAILSMQFNPDSTRLASASRDTTVHLWDARNSNLLHVFKGHTLWVNTVRFSHDGNMLASGGWDSDAGSTHTTSDGLEKKLFYSTVNKESQTANLRIWDCRNYQLIHAIKAHTQVVTSIDFNLNDEILVSVSFDKKIRLWDVKTGKEIYKLPGHHNWINAVKFSPDNKFVISGDHHGKILMWNIQQGAQIAELKGHKDCITGFSFIKGSNILISSSHDRTIRFWDISKGIQLYSHEGHTGSANSIDVNSNNYLVSGSDDNSVKIWKIIQHSEGLRLSLNWSSIAPLYSKNAQFYNVLGLSDNNVRLLKNENAIIIFEPTGEQVNIYSYLSPELQRVAYYLIQYKYTIYQRSFSQQDSHLLFNAVNDDRLDVIRYLVEHNMPLDEQDKDGFTALCRAIYQNKTPIAMYLIASNASHKIATYAGGTPLVLAVQVGNLALTKRLLPLEITADIWLPTGITLLMYAIRKGFTDIVRLLIEAGADINLSPKVPGMTVLDFIVLGSSMEVALLAYDIAPYLFTEELIFTAIDNIISLKCTSNSDINTDNNGVLAFLFLIINNFNYRDRKTNQTFLTLAILLGRLDLVKIACTPENINKQDNKGVSPLLYAITFEHPDIVKYLLEQGADPNLKQPSSGDTPLIHAAQKNNLPIVQLLCAKKANLNAQDNLGFTALQTAVQYGYAEIAEYLIKQGADYNIVTFRYKTGVLESAVLRGHLHVLKRLVPFVDCTRPNLAQESLLYCAVAEQQVDIVKYILEELTAIDINAKNIEGYAPISFAAKVDNIDIFEILHKKGADIDIVDINGNSLVMIAFGNKSQAVMQYLIKHGKRAELKALADKYLSHLQVLLDIPIDELPENLKKQAFSGTEIIQYCKSAYVAYYNMITEEFPSHLFYMYDHYSRFLSVNEKIEFLINIKNLLEKNFPAEKEAYGSIVKLTDNLNESLQAQKVSSLIKKGLPFLFFKDNNERYEDNSFDSRQALDSFMPENDNSVNNQNCRIS